jgi:hypothetical protein
MVAQNPAAAPHPRVTRARPGPGRTAASPPSPPSAWPATFKQWWAGNVKFYIRRRRAPPDGQIEAAVNPEEFNFAEALPSLPRLRAYEAVQAVVSDDNNFERGVAGARAVADSVLAEAGTAGLAETVVELALKLAEALERIASEQGLAAEDLAEVWFVE